MKSLLSFVLLIIILALGNADETVSPETPPAVEDPEMIEITSILESSEKREKRDLPGEIEDLVDPVPLPGEEDVPPEPMIPEELPEEIESPVPLTKPEESDVDEKIDNLLSEVGAEPVRPALPVVPISISDPRGPRDPDDLERRMLESDIPSDDLRELYASAGHEGSPEVLDILEDLVEEHNLTDEARMLFGLGECGTFDLSTCNKKMALRIWICEFSKHMREVKDWMAEFIDYKSGCAEADMLGMEMLEHRCLDQRDIECMDPSMRKCLLVGGCEMCRCLDRDDINEKYLLKIWKIELENYKERVKMYKKVKESCRSSGECSEDGKSTPDEEDEMGSWGSGIGDDEEEIMYR